MEESVKEHMARKEEETKTRRKSLAQIVDKRRVFTRLWVEVPSF